MSFLLRFIGLLCQVMTTLILIRVVMSWFTRDQANPLVRLVYQVTEPVLAPLRRILPPMGIFDLSPLIAFLLLQLIAFLVS